MTANNDDPKQVISDAAEVATDKVALAAERAALVVAAAAADARSQSKGLTASNVGAVLGILGTVAAAAGVIMTIGGMRSKAEATEQTAIAAKALSDASTTRLAVHDTQIRMLEAALSRIEGKIDAALQTKKQ